jgi:hypothetical protein
MLSALVLVWIKAGTSILVQLVHHIFALLGFVEAKVDTSLFIFHRGADTISLLLYVDDIILTATIMMLLCRTVSTL